MSFPQSHYGFLYIISLFNFQGPTHFQGLFAFFIWSLTPQQCKSYYTTLFWFCQALFKSFLKSFSAFKIKTEQHFWLLSECWLSTSARSNTLSPFVFSLVCLASQRNSWYYISTSLFCKPLFYNFFIFFTLSANFPYYSFFYLIFNAFSLLFCLLHAESLFIYIYM